MIQFDKPANLNGVQLVAELTAGGITVNDYPFIDGDGNFWLDIDPKDATKAKPIVAAHVAAPVPELTVAEKLESVGLTIADLKTALGLTV